MVFTEEIAMLLWGLSNRGETRKWGNTQEEERNVFRDDANTVLCKVRDLIKSVGNRHLPYYAYNAYWDAEAMRNAILRALGFENE